MSEFIFSLEVSTFTWKGSLASWMTLCLTWRIVRLDHCFPRLFHDVLQRVQIRAVRRRSLLVQGSRQGEGVGLPLLEVPQVQPLRLDQDIHLLRTRLVGLQEDRSSQIIGSRTGGCPTATQEDIAFGENKQKSRIS